MDHRLLPLLLLAACGGKAAPAGRPVDAPAPVTATVTRVLGDRDARIGRDGDAYEAEARTDLELVIAADGTLVETEVEIPVAIVPAAIRAAVEGEVHEAALIVTADGVVYELETSAHEVRVDAAGQIVGDEVEADDGDGDGDGDDDGDGDEDDDG